MQLKQIARDALLKPLQAVSGIVERRHTLPILANVLLEQREGQLYVTATDLEMQITAHSTLEGKDGQATTVGARKLQDLLRALPDDATLNVDVTSSKMTVRAGRSRFNLQTLPAADYPRISLGTEQLQTLSLPQRDLRKLFSDRPEHAGNMKAARFIARVRREVRRVVASWTGEYQYTIDQVLENMVQRSRELNLRLAAAEDRAKLDFTIMLTVQTMNYLHSGRHRVAL